MSRKYEEGIHPAYDRELQRLTSKDSPSRPSYEFLATRDHSKAGVLRVISEFQALTERRQKDLSAIDLKFENLKVTARREGKTEPAEMPRQLLDEKLRLEAQIDVISERVAEFKQEMAKFEAQEQAEQDAKILQYGPIGSGKLRDGILAEIDGQSIKVSRSGTLVINCPQSPYHKMKVEDYRSHVVALFSKARSEKDRELEDRIAEKARELQELRKSKSSFGARCIAREDLPARPAGF